MVREIAGYAGIQNFSCVGIISFVDASYGKFVRNSDSQEKMELIDTYFPDLERSKRDQYEQLAQLYHDWNVKVNVISRKDMDNFYLHHVLHSLVLAKYYESPDFKTILDVGTGGGFPGIPLAIYWPSIKFHLLDATGKKIKVVEDVAQSIGLQNVTGVHSRVEDYEGQFDLIVSRAVASTNQIVAWTQHLTKEKKWVFLKGGDPDDIRKELPPVYRMKFKPVTDYFPHDYFTGKFIIQLDLNR